MYSNLNVRLVPFKVPHKLQCKVFCIILVPVPHKLCLNKPSVLLSHIMDAAYYQCSYIEHPAIVNKFLCIKIADSNVKKFAYNEHPL